MLHPSGRFASVSAAWQLLLAMRWDVMTALGLTLLCTMVPPELERRLSPQVLLPLLGISVSVFTAFRNTQAFQRWWDARTHWSSMVDACREWRDVLIALRSPRSDPQLWDCPVKRQVLLAWQLNLELRGRSLVRHRCNDRPPYSALGLPAKLTTQELLCEQADGIAELVNLQQINDGPSRVLLFNAHWRALSAIGGLERIQQQPMPPYYDLFIRLIVWVFGLLLYLRMDELSTPNWSVIGFVCLVGFVTAERLGALLEDPFTSPVFGLPMDHICAGISADLLVGDHPLSHSPQGPGEIIWT